MTTYSAYPNRENNAARCRLECDIGRLYIRMRAEHSSGQVNIPDIEEKLEDLCIQWEELL